MIYLHWTQTKIFPKHQPNHKQDSQCTPEHKLGSPPLIKNPQKSLSIPLFTEGHTDTSPRVNIFLRMTSYTLDFRVNRLWLKPTFSPLGTHVTFRLHKLIHCLWCFSNKNSNSSHWAFVVEVFYTPAPHSIMATAQQLSECKEKEKKIFVSDVLHITVTHTHTQLLVVLFPWRRVTQLAAKSP